MGHRFSIIQMGATRKFQGVNNGLSGSNASAAGKTSGPTDLFSRRNNNNIRSLNSNSDASAGAGPDAAGDNGSVTRSGVSNSSDAKFSGFFGDKENNNVLSFDAQK